MVDNYDVGVALGGVLALGGIGLISAVNPVAGLGAAMLVVGVLAVLLVFVQKLLSTMGMGLSQLF